LDFTAISDLEA